MYATVFWRNYKNKKKDAKKNAQNDPRIIGYYMENGIKILKIKPGYAFGTSPQSGKGVAKIVRRTGA